MKCLECNTEYSDLPKCPKCGGDQGIRAFGEAKKQAYALKSEEAVDKFYECFAELVKNHAKVFAPINDAEELNLVISTFRGGKYIAIYSDVEGCDAGDAEHMAITDINRFIDCLYAYPDLQGIVVDPNKDPFYISRKQIHFSTVRKDPRLGEKDWGRGIPEYMEEDLKTPEELLDFGMEIIEEYFIEDEGYHVLESNRVMEGFPNYALEKDGNLYLMKVKVSVLEVPVLSQEEKEFYCSACEQYNAKCLYAPIVIASTDSERADKGIALYGDGYRLRYLDVEELN